MGMTPREVLLLLSRFHSLEFTIVLVLLPKVGAVSTIFIAVPGVVRVVVLIVVALVGVVGSRHHGWGDKVPDKNPLKMRNLFILLNLVY